MTKFRNAFALCLALLAGCAVGPDYVRPSAPTAAQYKEAGDWMPATPGDDVDRGAWWSIYKDPVLDLLERQVEVSNQNLKAAEAAYREASAIADETRANLFPLVSADAGATAAGNGKPHTKAATTYSISGNASWDLDVWGRIRRQLESDEANAQASAAELASAKLTAQALLATDYFSIRVIDENRRLLDATTEDFRKTLQIAQNQYDAGVAAKTDVIQAQTQLENARAQAINSGVLRAQIEHAIAVLIGKVPAEYSLAAAPLRHDIPLMPSGVPSALLQRRPDIASNERQMAAANAQIGVKTAAYFPDISINASAGFTNVVLGKLLQASSTLWSFGPALSQTVFDAGARASAVEASRAAYDQAVANYRQTVLTAFQQVEDNLSTLRILAEQAKESDAAVAHAREAEALVENQYKEGIVPFSSVLTAQNTRLQSEQTALSVHGNRLTASVGLIQALGGGWDASQLPR